MMLACGLYDVSRNILQFVGDSLRTLRETKQSKMMEVRYTKNILCITKNDLWLYRNSLRFRAMDGAYPEIVLQGLRIQRECGNSPSISANW